MLKRLLSLLFHLIMAAIVVTAGVCYRTSIYLCYQAKGQWQILYNTEPAQAYAQHHALTEKQKSNLALVEVIRKYAEDSLGFAPTHNYRSVYDQHDQPILWAVTASEGYALEPYYWTFPVVGEVSYKGFFDKEKALAEGRHLRVNGYDVEIRPVSAWSTLGWFKDPILSSMLDLPKASLCNLIFHELFHSTYYAPGSVEDNENLATFIGEKATLRFLQHDTASLNQYQRRKRDSKLFNDYIRRSIRRLQKFYDTPPVTSLQKIRLLVQIGNGIDSLPLSNHKRYQREKEEILEYRNAYFIGFSQYEQRQDSLEETFNKFYHGNLRNMVLDLKHKSGK